MRSTEDSRSLDLDGRSALALAQEAGHQDVVELLEQAGVVCRGIAGRACGPLRGQFGMMSPDRTIQPSKKDM